MKGVEGCWEGRRVKSIEERRREGEEGISQGGTGGRKGGTYVNRQRLKETSRK